MGPIIMLEKKWLHYNRFSDQIFILTIMWQKLISFFFL